jgi:hypothetical protein
MFVNLRYWYLLVGTKKIQTFLPAAIADSRAVASKIQPLKEFEINTMFFLK